MFLKVALFPLTLLGALALRNQPEPPAPTKAEPLALERQQAIRDLVFMHTPSNFGHTIEKVAMYPASASVQDRLNLIGGKGSSFEQTNAPLTWTDVMQVVSNVTGCNLYYTPQKYWPKSIAKRQMVRARARLLYFRFMTVFGVLRDPYERLVAYFRANQDYGGAHGKFHHRCDVNSAIKHMMKRYIESDNQFMENCAFLPQAEYFDGPYGVTLPVNNRKFPDSMNAVFKQHGYDDVVIQQNDILHVKDCSNVWAGDLDMETKKLVKKVYARDFQLICQYLGHCNEMENTCTEGVPDMCPPNVLATLKMKRFWTGETLKRS